MMIRSSKRMASSSAASLPEEMVTEVLLRLPVKSILRFRAVCRSWAAMSSSEEFRLLHSAMAKKAPSAATPKLFLVSPTESDSTAVYSCSPSNPKDDLLFTLDNARANSVEVVNPAPCHGVTLLQHDFLPAYYLCNAATREVTCLPPPFDASFSSTGLGFDSRTSKYKVVRLINGMPHDKETIKCEVYTGNGEDRWRPAATGVPFGLRRIACAAVMDAAVHKLPPVFANGSLHWLIRPSAFIGRPRASVVSFSIAEETFGFARPPPFWASEVDKPFWTRPLPSVDHLVEMDNQLCMVRDLRRNPYGSCLEIWKLLDYGSSDWSLDHRIDLSGRVARGLREPQVARVIGYIGNCRSGEKIIISTIKHKIHNTFEKGVHTYDTRSGAIETILSITETHASFGSMAPSLRFGLFEESLTSVRKTDEDIALLSTTLAKGTSEILLCP